jgi:hypothetical protein
LRICGSNKDFEKVDIVKGLIQASQKRKDKEIKARCKELDDAMTATDTDFWTRKMLRAIDGVAADKFGSCLNQVGMREDVYLTRLHQYVGEVETVIRQYAEDAAHAELVCARFRWAMQVREGHDVPMPLMTQTILTAIVISTEAVELGTSEVSVSIL